MNRLPADSKFMRTRRILNCLTATFFLGFFVFACQTAGSREAEKPKALQEFLLKLEGPVIVRGDFLKAINAAYTLDFAQKLLKLQEDPSSKTTSTSREKKWFSSVEDYDIEVRMEGKNYFVSFSRTLRGDAPESFGGGAQYVVDSRTFELLSKSYTK